MTIELRIDLKDIKSPLIWRQIKVPPHITFHDLHLIIQAAFGWHNKHLYQFAEKEFSLIRICSPHDTEAPINAEIIPVQNLLIELYNDSLFNPKDNTSLQYIYDYGDNWVHEIKTLGVDHSTDTIEYIDGEGACPPEDCGGIRGFEDIKTSLMTGKPSVIHDESWIPWLEGCGYKNYKPEYLDIKSIKRQIKKLS